MGTLNKGGICASVLFSLLVGVLSGCGSVTRSATGEIEIYDERYVPGGMISSVPASMPVLSSATVDGEGNILLYAVQSVVTVRQVVRKWTEKERVEVERDGQVATVFLAPFVLLTPWRWGEFAEKVVGTTSDEWKSSSRSEVVSGRTVQAKESLPFEGTMIVFDGRRNEVVHFSQGRATPFRPSMSGDLIVATDGADRFRIGSIAVQELRAKYGQARDQLDRRAQLARESTACNASCSKESDDAMQECHRRITCNGRYSTYESCSQSMKTCQDGVVGNQRACYKLCGAGESSNSTVSLTIR